MTENEAKKFVKQLKHGKRYGAKFHENEWGIKYRGNNMFLVWSRSVDFFTNSDGNMDANENYDEETKSEKEIISLLIENYDYQIMLSNLKEERF